MDTTGLTRYVKIEPSDPDTVNLGRLQDGAEEGTEEEGETP